VTKTLSVSVPHRLGQEEARRRLESGFADLQGRFAGSVSNVQQTWTDNRLDFRFSALGGTVSGRLEVLPESVKIDIDLPWLLAALAEKLRPTIEQEGRKLLDKK